MNLPHSKKRNFTNGEVKLLARNDLTRYSASRSPSLYVFTCRLQIRISVE
jgi:hypothetical protein